MIRKDIKSPRPLFVKHGRNTGKVIGNIYFKENYPAYLLIEKSVYFRRPDLKRMMWISHTAIEDALELGVKLVIYHLLNFEEGRSFYVIYDINEFVKSKKIIRFEVDPQKGCLWGQKPRFYSFPKSLGDFVLRKEQEVLERDLR